MDPEKLREYRRAYARKWRARNRERANQLGKQYRSSLSPERRKECADYNKNWKKNNHGRMQVYQYKWTLRECYGLDYAGYLDLLKSQDGRCALCLDPIGSERFLCVDHDHDTGKIRGLLCRECNGRLGLSKSVEWMQRAITYLQESEKR